VKVAQRPTALDWLELVQRGCVLVRALNGQTEEAITADHARELARAQKVRQLWAAVERWASDGGRK
jgi:hypothetical protein